MANKQKEPENMMDFILNKMSSEDLATAEMIRPLPASVQPSSEFLASMRAQIMNAVQAEGREVRAA